MINDKDKNKDADEVGYEGYLVTSLGDQSLPE